MEKGHRLWTGTKMRWNFVNVKICFEICSNHECLSICKKARNLSIHNQLANWTQIKNRKWKFYCDRWSIFSTSLQSKRFHCTEERQTTTFFVNSVFFFSICTEWALGSGHWTHSRSPVNDISMFGREIKINSWTNMNWVQSCSYKCRYDIRSHTFDMICARELEWEIASINTREYNIRIACRYRPFFGPPSLDIYDIWIIL